MAFSLLDEKAGKIQLHQMILKKSPMQTMERKFQCLLKHFDGKINFFLLLAHKVILPSGCTFSSTIFP
jgi:hypothetical protein